MIRAAIVAALCSLSALAQAQYSTAYGQAALSFNANNPNDAFGYAALYHNTTGGSNNITIGNGGTAADNGVIRIGTAGTHTATYIAGINGVASPKGIQVFVNANGQLGTFTSSRRYKQDIHSLGDLSGTLMALRAVSFRYKQAAEDGTHPVQYGLIAEEVAKVCPELVAYDKSGKPYSVAYHLLTPLLLKQLQSEHRRVVDLQSAHAVQQSQISAQSRSIADLKAAHNAQLAQMRALLTRQSQELAALKQQQQQQLQVLARLATSLQSRNTDAARRQVALLQH